MFGGGCLFLMALEVSLNRTHTPVIHLIYYFTYFKVHSNKNRDGRDHCKKEFEVELPLETMQWVGKKVEFPIRMPKTSTR